MGLTAADVVNIAEGAASLVVWDCFSRADEGKGVRQGLRLEADGDTLVMEVLAPAMDDSVYLSPASARLLARGLLAFADGLEDLPYQPS